MICTFCRIHLSLSELFDSGYYYIIMKVKIEDTLTR